MQKSKNLPTFVRRVDSYPDLEAYASAFAEGHLNFLMVFGDPGLGKSQRFRNAVGKEAGWIAGTASPFGIYRLAYEFMDRPLVLDDVDGLYRDPNGVRLLKCLCQTDRVKVVSWQTNAADVAGVPRTFNTCSRVAIIANQWGTLNKNVGALEDRGHAISFEPSAAEVHRNAVGWFRDAEILDFIESQLHLIEQPSLRMYVTARELKSAGLNWKDAVLNRMLSGTTLQVALLKADTSFCSEEARVEAFIAKGCGCRATYFNHAKRLQKPSLAASVVANLNPLQFSFTVDSSGNQEDS